MNNLPNLFFSLDWGTSSFRLRLVDTQSLQPLAESASDEGVTSVFTQWQQSGEGRLRYYLALVKKHVVSLGEKTAVPLQHLPLVVSGMAGSTLGMAEAGYTELPFAVDGSNLTVHAMNATKHFPHPVYLISGARTGDDVMRGEETQVVGCIESEAEESVIVLPGTHSKHVFVKAGQAMAFRTYMTGEFFHLLSQESILANSVAQGEILQDAASRQSFQDGVRHGAGSNLLQACFQVRTNQLFQKVNKAQNYFYLSGLLIGAEVHDLIQYGPASVTIVSNERLAPLYAEAIHSLLPKSDIREVNATDAVIKGQYRIFARQKANA